MNSSPRLIAIDTMSSEVCCLMLSKIYLIELVAFFNISGISTLKILETIIKRVPKSSRPLYLTKYLFKYDNSFI